MVLKTDKLRLWSCITLDFCGHYMHIYISQVLSHVHISGNMHFDQDIYFRYIWKKLLLSLSLIIIIHSVPYLHSHHHHVFTRYQDLIKDESKIENMAIMNA